MNQSIIVYRNPLEKALWENLMNGQFIPIFAACLVFLVVLVGLLAALDKFFPRFAYRKDWKSSIVNVLIWSSAGVAAAYTVKYLWI
jgi:hypothetical protein